MTKIGKKCSKCGGHNTWKVYGHSTPTKGQFAGKPMKYKQTVCHCGHEGVKHYYYKHS